MERGEGEGWGGRRGEGAGFDEEGAGFDEEGAGFDEEGAEIDEEGDGFDKDWAEIDEDWVGCDEIWTVPDAEDSTALDKDVSGKDSEDFVERTEDSPRKFEDSGIAEKDPGDPISLCEALKPLEFLFPSDAPWEERPRGETTEKGSPGCPFLFLSPWASFIKEKEEEEDREVPAKDDSTLCWASPSFFSSPFCILASLSRKAFSTTSFFRSRRGSVKGVKAHQNL